MWRNPRHPFPYDECGWDHVDDTSVKLLNNTLVENWVSGRLWTDVTTRLCSLRDGLPSTRGDEDKPNYRSPIGSAGVQAQSRYLKFFEAC